MMVRPETVYTQALSDVACFSESLHGLMPLEYSLQSIASSLGAEAVLLSRIVTGTEIARPAAIHDSKSGKAQTVPLVRGFAKEILGERSEQYRAGTVQVLSRLREADPVVPGDLTLRKWMSGRAIRDVAVISLSAAPQRRDYLEIYFLSRISDELISVLELIGVLLAQFHASRLPGIIASALSQNTAARRKTGERKTSRILSYDNPAGLTRAEFRICTLISRGLSQNAIRDELGVSIHTVRAHMRQIYSKTGTNSFYELAHQLVSVDGRAVAMLELTQSA